MVSHMIKHEILQIRKAIMKSEQSILTRYKATLSKLWNMKKLFLIDTFKAAFMT